MVKKQECSFCHRALSGAATRRMKEGKIHCCDTCAMRFIDAGLNSTELDDRGINYTRALKLGWAPVAIRCPSCHRFFFPGNSGNQKFCREKGCISASRGSGSYHRMRISTQHENMGEPACKTVICTPMNAYRDKLIDAFPIITKEEFNETRKIVMQVACKDYVMPRGIAPAIFYMTLKRLNKNIIAQEKLAAVLGSSSVTLRYYIKRYGHLFRMSIKKRKRMT